VGDLLRKFRISGWMMLVAVAMLAAYDSGVCAGSNVWAQCTGSNVTFKNQNSFPIWLGENVTGPTNIVLPPPDKDGKSRPAAKPNFVCRRSGVPEYSGLAPNATSPARSAMTRTTRLAPRPASALC
jgi:hypothetical protein